jgi:hypothetical protein
MEGHSTKSIHLNERQAQNLAILVANDMKWPVYDVRYTGRNTKRVTARVWPSQKRMIVNTSGERVSTILHELAHHIGVKHGHNNLFKSTHIKLLNLWETKWESQLATTILEKYDMGDGEPAPMPVKSSYDEVGQYLIDIVDELNDTYKNASVPMVVLGKKLVEYGINNLINLMRLKTLVVSEGMSIR